jgi:hypothetical protein
MSGTHNTTFLAALAALANLDSKSSPTTGQIFSILQTTCPSSHEDLVRLHESISSNEELRTFFVRLFLAQLQEILTREKTKDPLPECHPGCTCCLETKYDRDHRVQSDANARVAKLIEDPSSSESSNLLEKYAETALKGVCDHLMYD